MKNTTIFLATVALSCCGISSSSAQVKFNWNTGQPRLAPHLVSMQSEVTENEADAPAKEVIGNPFDLFSDEASAPSPADLQPGQPVAELDEASGDPASLPVGRHHRLRNQSQATVDYSMIEGIPAASLAPAIWCQSTCTQPNPVAQVMLRQDCNVQDLWAGYPGERAQECADMWNRIAGHQNCGCQAAAPACQACPQGVRNRYAQAPSACDRTARHVPANVAFSHVR